MHVVGDCSSMAAYVMLAGDGDVEFEPNSIVVLHNPWSLAIGDYKAMQKEANILEELAKLYAKAFVERVLFEEAEIRAIMDEETWFMGDNLKKLGVVLGDSDSDSDSDDDESEGSKELKIAAFRERMSEAKAKLKEMKAIDDEQTKIAALLPSFAQSNKEAKKDIEEPKGKGENKMVKSLEELKAQNITVYNEAIDEGKKAEQKRVASLMKFIDVDKNAVVKAINDGVGVNDDEFQASILMAKTSKKQLGEMEQENPETVNPQTETHAPEGEGEGEELTEEQKAEAQKKADDEKFNAILNAMGVKQ